MKVAVIGCGVVGGALVRWLKNYSAHEIAQIDGPRGLSDSLDGIQAAFLCVPVPTQVDRKQDLKVLAPWVEKLAKDHQDVPIFIRSTVLPGTCDEFAKRYEARGGVYAMPEFLTASRPDEDMRDLPIICGGESELSNEFIQLIFPGKPLIRMSNTEAEITKYTHNTFGALKVNYFNTVFELCRKFQANYTAVREAAQLTGFIEPTHTQVPGPDGRFGFGGACLPKDLSAFIGLLYDMRVLGADTLENVENNNWHYRRKRVVELEPMVTTTQA